MSGNEANLEITVIIPTYNRSSTLERCLNNLAAQTLSKAAYEVIVADDGSLDGTGETVRRLARASELRLRYLQQAHSGANAARNRAVRAAQGRLLLFINDDTLATPNMLEEHLRVHALHASDNSAVLGRVTISRELPPSIFAKLHLDANYALWEGQTELDWRAFYTCNVSVKSSFLLRHGLFEERLHYHEDLELSERLSRFSLKVIYHPQALAHHYHYLGESDYLAIARREGESLSKWRRISPLLGPKLAHLGYYPDLPFRYRLKYLLADSLVNPLTIPMLLALARSCSTTQEAVSLFIYRKIFQALKRSAIRRTDRLRESL